MICDDCGKELHVGDFPFCPHGRIGKTHPFVSFLDENVSGEPVLVTGLGQWNKLMKDNGMEIRDKPSPGDLSARIDRIEQHKRQQSL